MQMLPVDHVQVKQSADNILLSGVFNVESHPISGHLAITFLFKYMSCTFCHKCTCIFSRGSKIYYGINQFLNV